MVTYESDPYEFWGLQILGDSYLFQTPACLSGSQNEPTLYIEQFPRELQFTNQHDNVENDELLAYSLQEELNQLAVTEASGTGDSSESHQQASFLAENWIGHSMAYSSLGSDQEKEFEPPTSHSTTETKMCDGEDYYGSLQMTDTYSAWDDGLRRRLNLIPVAHVPKINGEIPSTDEATSDHQRLLDRLQLYNLTELKVQGDGNCQFRALSDQFYRTPEHHNFVRQEIVNQLSAHPEIYAGYVPMAYSDYIEKMSRDGEWGDHVTLQAAADWYGVKICVFTSFKDTCFIEISPNVQKSTRVIFLSFWAEVHYNSIYPEGEDRKNHLFLKIMGYEMVHQRDDGFSSTGCSGD